MEKAGIFGVAAAAAITSAIVTVLVTNNDRGGPTTKRHHHRTRARKTPSDPSSADSAEGGAALDDPDPAVSPNFPIPPRAPAVGRPPSVRGADRSYNDGASGDSRGVVVDLSLPGDSSHDAPSPVASPHDALSRDALSHYASPHAYASAGASRERSGGDPRRNLARQEERPMRSRRARRSLSHTQASPSRRVPTGLLDPRVSLDDEDEVEGAARRHSTVQGAGPREAGLRGDSPSESGGDRPGKSCRAESLRHTETLVRMWDASPLLVIVTDVDGELLYASPQLLALVGMSERSVAALGPAAILHTAAPSSSSMRRAGMGRLVHTRPWSSARSPRSTVGAGGRNRSPAARRASPDVPTPAGRSTRHRESGLEPTAPGPAPGPAGTGAGIARLRASSSSSNLVTRAGSDEDLARLIRSPTRNPNRNARAMRTTSETVLASPSDPDGSPTPPRRHISSQRAPPSPSLPRMERGLRRGSAISDAATAAAASRRNPLSASRSLSSSGGALFAAPAPGAGPWETSSASSIKRGTLTQKDGTVIGVRISESVLPFMFRGAPFAIVSHITTVDTELELRDIVSSTRLLPATPISRVTSGGIGGVGVLSSDSGTGDARQRQLHRNSVSSGNLRTSTSIPEIADGGTFTDAPPGRGGGARSPVSDSPAARAGRNAHTVSTSSLLLLENDSAGAGGGTTSPSVAAASPSPGRVSEDGSAFRATSASAFECPSAPVLVVSMPEAVRLPADLPPSRYVDRIRVAYRSIHRVAVQHGCVMLPPNDGCAIVVAGTGPGTIGSGNASVQLLRVAEKLATFTYSTSGPHDMISSSRGSAASHTGRARGSAPGTASFGGGGRPRLVSSTSSIGSITSSNGSSGGGGTTGTGRAGEGKEGVDLTIVLPEARGGDSGGSAAPALASRPLSFMIGEESEESDESDASDGSQSDPDAASIGIPGPVTPEVRAGDAPPPSAAKVAKRATFAAVLVSEAAAEEESDPAKPAQEEEEARGESKDRGGPSPAIPSSGFLRPARALGRRTADEPRPEPAANYRTSSSTVSFRVESGLSVEQLERRPLFHLGMHAGPVVVGDLLSAAGSGDNFLTVMGSTIEIARTISGSAGHGQVLLSEAIVNILGPAISRDHLRESPGQSDGVARVFLYLPPSLGSVAESLRSLSLGFMSRDIFSVVSREDIESRLPEAAVRNITSWNFNASSLTKEEGIDALMLMFHHRGFLDPTVGIDAVILRRFLMEASETYVDVPYHNFLHAVDVAQAAFLIMDVIADGHGSSPLSGAQSLALFISAVCHDLGHQGLNNRYHTISNSSLALQYHYRSVLEQLHCSHAFRLLTRADCDFLAFADPMLRDEVRSLLAPTILATDMAFHGSFVKRAREEAHDIMQFCAAASAGQASGDPGSTNTLELILGLLVKISDISNISRPFHIARHWGERLHAEWLLQGDLETEQGLPVLDFMDRDKDPSLPSGQAGFVSGCGIPFLAALTDLFPGFESLLHQAQDNLKSWEFLVDTTVWSTGERRLVPLESASGTRSHEGMLTTLLLPIGEVDDAEEGEGE